MTATAEEGQPTVLGERLNNPYTIPNMKAAKEALDDEGIKSDVPLNIRATHYYVKFMPETFDDLYTLMADSSLVLSDCPIDYEKLVVGNFYVESGLPEGVPTPHYASVEVDQELNPDIPHEIIETMYIPEEDPLLIGPDGTSNLYYMNSLLNFAYHMADSRYDMPIFDPKDFLEGGIFIPKTPTGTISIHDDRLGANIPLEGVKVSASRWFTTYSGYTNASGQYYLDGYFVRSADYTIRFKRPGAFIIARNTVYPSKIVRNDISGNHWNHTITPGYDNMQGQLFRGAYRYYYQNVSGL